MKKTRILSLVLALMMIISLVPAAVAEDEPIKITVAGYLYGPVIAEKDVITPAVEEKLLKDHGINVDIEIVYIEQSEYSNIISERLVGGTAPDVFLAQGDDTLQTYYDQGAIKSWSKEFFQANAPAVYDFMTSGAAYGDLINDVDKWWTSALKDGQMVVVPSFKPDGSMPYKTLIYRGDWIEKLGYTDETLPKTVDGYVELLTKFAKEDPDGDGQDNTYGCSITGIKTLFGAYGLATGFSGSNTYWTVKDGKVVNGDVTDEAKEVLKIAAKLYADGVIDPEFVTGTEAISGSYWAISNGLVNGIYGASANASIDHYRLKGITSAEDAGGRCATEYWAVNGEDSTFVYAPWPAGPSGDYGWQVGFSVAVSESAVYNAKMSDEKLAVILQILNAFATDDDLFMLAAYGIEGEHYTKNENGTVTRNAEFTNETFNEIGLWGCRSLYGGDRALSKLAYDLVFYNDVSIANRLNWFKKDQYNSYIQDAVSVLLPSSDLFTEVNTIRDEAYVEFITGAVDVEEGWDAFVEAYMEAGGEILEAEANEWYASTH